MLHVNFCLYIFYLKYVCLYKLIIIIETKDMYRKTAFRKVSPTSFTYATLQSHRFPWLHIRFDSSCSLVVARRQSAHLYVIPSLYLLSVPD